MEQSALLQQLGLLITNIYYLQYNVPINVIFLAKLNLFAVAIIRATYVIWQQVELIA